MEHYHRLLWSAITQLSTLVAIKLPVIVVCDQVSAITDPLDPAKPHMPLSEQGCETTTVACKSWTQVELELARANTSAFVQ